MYQHNRRQELWHHFNPRRVYAEGVGAGLLNATWPRGGRPEQALPYADEVWPGAEYTAAIAMLGAGLIEEALTVVSDTRRRHDGQTRNPFNEAEAGNHYVRSLSAWGLIPAYTGFGYSRVSGELKVAYQAGVYPWFASAVFGTYVTTVNADRLGSTCA